MLVTGFESITPLSIEDGGFFVDECADLHPAFKIYRIVINLPKFHTAKHLSHSDNSLLREHLSLTAFICYYRTYKSKSMKAIEWAIFLHKNLIAFYLKVFD